MTLIWIVYKIKSNPIIAAANYLLAIVNLSTFGLDLCNIDFGAVLLKSWSISTY